MSIKLSEIKRLVDTPRPVILEVGANDGYDTIRFLQEMPRARIVCFEPDPRPLARFCCRDDKRVTLLEVAVADREYIAELKLSGGRSLAFPTKMPNNGDPADWDLSSSLLQPTEFLHERHQWLTFDKTATVQAAPLDAFRDEHYPHVDFIWADVQGAEALLILGGQETLRHTRFFYTEYYDTPQYRRQPSLAAIEAFLPGWDLARTYGGNALFINRHYGKQA